MIYDTFTFFDEVELLDLRLHELAGVVDKFVLVEATKTHSNQPKPLHYAENKKRFSAFHDKIIHVVVNDMPDSQDPWTLLPFQRNCIRRGLVDCRPDDIILVSDLDEIPRATTIMQASQELQYDNSLPARLIHTVLKARPVTKVFRRPLRKHHPYIRVFEQTMYYYFLNCLCVTFPTWGGTHMLHYRDFVCAEEARYSGHVTVKNGGWHFSFMGGVDRIRQKLGAYSHQEFNTPEYTDPQRLSQLINGGKDIFRRPCEFKFVELDKTYPRYVLENRDMFAGWIKGM